MYSYWPVVGDGEIASGTATEAMEGLKATDGIQMDTAANDKNSTVRGFTSGANALGTLGGGSNENNDPPLSSDAPQQRPNYEIESELSYDPPHSSAGLVGDRLFYHLQSVATRSYDDVHTDAHTDVHTDAHTDAHTDVPTLGRGLTSEHAAGAQQSVVTSLNTSPSPSLTFQKFKQSFLCWLADSQVPSGNGLAELPRLTEELFHCARKQLHMLLVQHSNSKYRSWQSIVDFGETTGSQAVGGNIRISNTTSASRSSGVKPSDHNIALCLLLAAVRGALAAGVTAATDTTFSFKESDVERAWGGKRAIMHVTVYTCVCLLYPNVVLH